MRKLYRIKIRMSDLAKFKVPNCWQPHVKTIVEWFVKTAQSSNAHTEIEGRLGQYNQQTQKFDSTVSSEWFFEKLTHFMAPGASWDRIEEETTTSYLFPNGVRAVQSANETAVFIRKIRRSTVDAQFEGSGHHIRLSHAVELPQDPPCDTPTWVRKRNRRSFYIGAFRFDFSNILEAPTLQAAIEQPIKYEIEIEYVPQQIAQHSDDSNWQNKTFCALTILCLLHDLSTPNGSDCTENALPLHIERLKESR